MVCVDPCSVTHFLELKAPMSRDPGYQAACPIWLSSEHWGGHPSKSLSESISACSVRDGVSSNGDPLSAYYSWWQALVTDRCPKDPSRTI